MIYYIGEKRDDVTTTTLKHCVDYCSKLQICGLDIETSRKFKKGTYPEEIYKPGLDPYSSNICMIQVGDENNQFIIDARKVKLDALIDFLNWNKEVLFVGHNLAFEGKFLRNKYNIRLKKVYDTMLGEISLYNGLNIKLSLQALSKKYLGIKSAEDFDLFSQYKVTLDDDSDSDSITPFELEDLNLINKSIRLGFIDLWDTNFTTKQILYGTDDIIYPLLIRKEQLKGHNILGFHFCNEGNILFESEYTQVGADMELNGLYLNSKVWKELESKYKAYYEACFLELKNYIIKYQPHYAQLDLFSSPKCLIEWSSPAQVIRLFRELKICPKEKSKQTKRMEYSVSSKALLPTLKYKKEFYKDKLLPITDTETLKLAYLLLRKAQMNITTYGLDFLKYIHPITNRLHPKYKLHLISSRTATISPNLLAIPSTHRAAFEGNLIVNDYSSQESRIIAGVSEDDLLIDFFNYGHELFKDDFHSYTSSLVEKIKKPDIVIYPKGHELCTKEMEDMRQKIKSVNFGLAYGITAISLSKQLQISKLEAEELVNNYFLTFQGLHNFLEFAKKDALDKGYVIFEPRLNAIFIQEGYDDIKRKEKKCQSYFFNEKYYNLTQKERELYKKNLYKNNPHIKEWYSDIGIMKSRLGNRGCNLRIQGLAAKQTKLAQIWCRRYSIDNPHLNWQILLILHDEIVSEGNLKYSDFIFKQQSLFMKKAADFFCPTVTFDTSGGVSDYWKH